MAGNSSSAGYSVSSKLLSVLGCFEINHQSLTLTQVAERARLPLSTARRLIQELVKWGGLERNDDATYSVGIRLWTVGSLASQPRTLRDAAYPYMHDLYEATQENVQLMVLDGSEALCIEKISASKAVPTATHVGGRLPLHATGVGKALLAFGPRGLLASTVHQGLERRTANTIIEPGRLAAAVLEVRRTGVAFSFEEMTRGAVSVAAPVLDSTGTLRGALGIVAHSLSRVDRLAPAVRTAALGISRSVV